MIVYYRKHSHGGICLNQNNCLKIITAIENTEYLKKISDNIAEITNVSLLASLRNSSDIVTLCTELSPDILICDLSNQDSKMSTTIKDICHCKNRHSVRIIATASSKEGEQLISDSIQNGADIFMENLDNPDILKSTLRIIGRQKDGSINSKDKIYIKADEILHQLKLPVHFSGYHYMKAAIINTALRETKLPEFSCKMCERIAKEFNTNPRHVERAITKAVRHVNSVCPKDYIFDTILGYSINGYNYSLNAKELIALIADQLRLRYISL